MIEKSVLFIKTGSIRPHEKARCTKSGVMVIEVDHPADIRPLPKALGLESLSTAELLSAAGIAIGASKIAQEAFGHAVADALAKRLAR